MRNATLVQPAASTENDAMESRESHFRERNSTRIFRVDYGDKHNETGDTQCSVAPAAVESLSA